MFKKLTNNFNENFAVKNYFTLPPWTRTFLQLVIEKNSIKTLFDNEPFNLKKRTDS